MMGSSTPNATLADEPSRPSASEQTPLLRNSSISSSAERIPNGGAAAPSSSRDGHVHGISILRGIAISLSLWVLIFLQSSNMSGMVMVQGTIAEDLDSHESAMWFSTSYLIAMSALAPVAGRLATIFTPRLLMLPISVLVATGTLVSARAHSFAVFVLGRVLTGTGAAGILTLSLIFVLELTDKKRRGVFVGLVNAGLTIGVSVGAVVYGALLPAIGWRPLFWIQAPFSLVAGLGVYLSVPAALTAGSNDDRVGSTFAKLRRIDYLGATLLTLSIVLFLYGLAGEIEPIPLLLSLVSLSAFVATEFLIASDPIIPVNVLSSRGVLLSCIAQLGLMTARWSVLFYSPIFMLAVRGAAMAAAGSILIPTNFGFALGGLIVGWLHVRRAGSFWLPSLVSVAGFSAALYFLTLAGTPRSPVWGFVALVFVNGFATGAALNYTLAHVLHLTPENTQYVSTSLIGTFRGFGGSFGTSIGGGIFYRLLRRSLTKGFLDLDNTNELSLARRRLVSRLLGTPALVFHGGLDDQETQIAIEGYAGAARGVWQAAAALALIVILIQAATGWKAPEKKGDPMDEENAHAIVEENEGVGEA